MLLRASPPTVRGRMFRTEHAAPGPPLDVIRLG